jgi:hypothetical protein
MSSGFEGVETLLARERLTGRTRSLGSRDGSLEIVGLLGPATSMMRAECTLDDLLIENGLPISDSDVEELPAIDTLDEVIISAFS